MTKKQYINIDGIWHEVHTTNDWYDWLCWALAVGLLGTVGFAALTGRLAC